MQKDYLHKLCFAGEWKTTRKDCLHELRFARQRGNDISKIKIDEDSMWIQKPKIRKNGWWMQSDEWYKDPNPKKDKENE